MCRAKPRGTLSPMYRRGAPEGERGDIDKLLTVGLSIVVHKHASTIA